MQNNTKFYYFFSNSRMILLLIVAIVAGIFAVPGVVTRAQQPTATPPLPNFLPNPTAGSNYAGRMGCSGVVANPSDEAWQVWPSNGIIELGNGTQPATIEIRQCSGYYPTADETRLIEVWIQPQPNGEFINIPYEPTAVSLVIGDSEYAADAIYEFPIDSQPGKYKLFIGNNDRGWLNYDFEVRTGPRIQVQDPIMDSPKTEFQPGEIVEIKYRWFRPNSRVEVGLYRIENTATPLVATWKVTVDQSGNFRGQLSISDNFQLDTSYQLAACSLDEGPCDPVLSETFTVVPNTDASAPFNSDSSLPNEIPSN